MWKARVDFRVVEDRESLLFKCRMQNNPDGGVDVSISDNERMREIAVMVAYGLALLAVIDHFDKLGIVSDFDNIRDSLENAIALTTQKVEDITENEAVRDVKTLPWMPEYAETGELRACDKCGFPTYAQLCMRCYMKEIERGGQ